MVVWLHLSSFAVESAAAAFWKHSHIRWLKSVLVWRSWRMVLNFVWKNGVVSLEKALRLIAVPFVVTLWPGWSFAVLLSRLR